jgi:molecular chaperone Hsp33
MGDEKDSLTRFLLEHANVRGCLVRLHDSWQNITARTDYPPVVADYLAQCTVASALFTASLKLDGRLSIQLRGDAAIRRLFSECSSDGEIRAIAHFDEPVPQTLSLQDFGESAVLAITIETQAPSQREPYRYQGIVSLNSDSLAHAFEQYFEQSEQLPTRLVLFKRGDQAAGLLIQQLPGQTGQQEDWVRAQMLFDTLRPDELFDLAPEEILYRLFHEEAVRVLNVDSLRFGCSCSRERVENALISLGQDEIAEAIAENGEITVNCDFCGQAYLFSAEQSLALFWPKTVLPGSERLH